MHGSATMYNDDTVHAPHYKIYCNVPLFSNVVKHLLNQKLQVRVTVGCHCVIFNINYSGLCDDSFNLPLKDVKATGNGSLGKYED